MVYATVLTVTAAAKIGTGVQRDEEPLGLNAALVSDDAVASASSSLASSLFSGYRARARAT